MYDLILQNKQSLCLVKKQQNVISFCCFNYLCTLLKLYIVQKLYFFYPEVFQKDCLSNNMAFEKKEIKLPSDVTGNGVAHPRHWLAAYVRLCHEKKVSQQLTKMGIENFLPVQEEIHQWSDRRKKIERILIPMIIFVHVDTVERSRVLTLLSVSRYMVLRGKSTPAVIPDYQMERFKFMLDHSDESIQLTDAPLSPGEKIRVMKGPLTGLEGELVTVDGGTKIVVRINLLGYASVKIPVSFVERIK